MVLDVSASPVVKIFVASCLLGAARPAGFFSSVVVRGGLRPPRCARASHSGDLRVSQGAARPVLLPPRLRVLSFASLSSGHRIHG